ncbi:hypothetical protein PC129_g8612 [Phytophthora cactorum]|uniref:Large-conductance mechanosensitive channel n=1 Tax=Phytophthora cactorum TaxID=29920 RepID=A0A329S162_9STRA|nr:hypothetical protein Pcac1_g18324 [Phytophthora cactorum]KAG2798559.1 hypothetical protein PC111_g20804 [Phytophthora cactorum]KAG2822556.1 hypothetical protein PC112_g10882 [Phytophthora cactorum]KAG2847061.1 hypothetical protein PC113_g17856 [Phytophthora cactorum]KAG2897497.1 hypothetical protein PC115_g17155 [Phytophthora cactorum]
MVSSVLCRQWPTLRRWNPFAPPPPPPESASLLDRMQEFANRELLTSRALLTDFQDFIQQGNMIDMAVGLILGSSFSAILDSLVVDIMSPIISLVTVSILSPIIRHSPADRSLANYYWAVSCPTSATECTNETWETWKKAREDGAVTINYGLFVENAVTFLINAVFLFFAVKKVFEVVFKRDVLVKKQCPYCKEFVKGDATRCKYCSSGIEYPSSSRGLWMAPG